MDLWERIRLVVRSKILAIFDQHFDDDGDKIGKAIVRLKKFPGKLQKLEKRWGLVGNS